jgi:hypothetical protein
MAARANLTAVAADQTVRVLDVSYGGFRIEFSPGAAPPASHGFDLRVGDLSVYASAVWMKQEANERLSCGAAISSELQKSDAWRELVDEALSH